MTESVLYSGTTSFPLLDSAAVEDWEYNSCVVLAALCFPQAVGRWAAIAISDSHAAGLSCEGQLYTWGNNNRGQLGMGDKAPGVVDTPVPVQALAADLDVK